MYMLRFLHTVLFCCVLLWAAVVSAQEQDSLFSVLPEVDVVDAVLPAAITSAVPLRRVSDEDIRRLGFAGVTEVLKYMSGVDVRD